MSHAATSQLEFSKDVTPEQINAALKAAAAGRCPPISNIVKNRWCSIDFKGNAHSAIVDALSTIGIGGNMIKVIAWYDNEWGYSCRLGDLADFVAKKGYKFFSRIKLFKRGRQSPSFLVTPAS